MAMTAQAMTAKQWHALREARRATDGETPLQRSGEATVRGIVLRGPTAASLVKRGLIAYGGMCAEVDGDGFTAAGDAPWYAITDAGREALRVDADRLTARVDAPAPTVPA